MIIHFDVDEYLNQFLSGEKSPLPVMAKTLKLIKHKDQITSITIKSHSIITPQVLTHFPKLQLIVSRTVGVDHIDLVACEEKGIAVYNIPSYGPQHVAQHGVALMLAGARNIVSANNATHKGNFSYKNFLGISLDGKTLGVIGTGKIGLEFIKIAKSLGMKIIAFDIFKNEKAAKDLGFEYVTVEKLLKTSDVITLHIPATKETKHMLNNKTLPLVKKGAILVNTARGDLIDTKALIKNITNFHAVCLDVLEDEALFSKTHPLLKFSNVIITPHAAFFSDGAVQVIARETMVTIKRWKKGDKMNRVV